MYYPKNTLLSCRSFDGVFYVKRIDVKYPAVSLGKKYPYSRKVIFIEDFWLLPESIPEAVTSVSEAVLLVRRIGKYVLLFHDLDTRNTG